MPLSIDKIPHDFPLGCVLSECTDNGEPNGHQLYVKERWKGLSPKIDYVDLGGRNPDGSVGDYWQMGCLQPGCEAARSSVFTKDELLRELKKGRIVGFYRNGLLVMV